MTQSLTAEQLTCYCRRKVKAVGRSMARMLTC
jgi:hypothetical protein